MSALLDGENFLASFLFLLQVKPPLLQGMVEFIFKKQIILRECKIY